MVDVMEVLVGILEGRPCDLQHLHRELKVLAQRSREEPEFRQVPRARLCLV